MLWTSENLTVAPVATMINPFKSYKHLSSRSLYILLMQLQLSPPSMEMIQHVFSVSVLQPVRLMQVLQLDR